LRILIFYFSGTGNTSLITEELSVRLKNAGCHIDAVSVESLDENQRELNLNIRKAGLLGFGFPVYKFSFPSIMEKLKPFLENLAPDGKPFFVFSTYCRFTASSLHRMAAFVELSSGSSGPVAMQSFKCPSNGIASMKDANSSEYTEVMYFEPGINTVLDSFAFEIINGAREYYSVKKIIKHRGGFADTNREKLVGRIEQARYPKLSIDENCIVCGLCVRKCPDNNLTLENRGGADGTDERYVLIHDDMHCLHCLRCLHICPKKAVSFGPLVTGPMRYTPKIRKELFQEAAGKPSGTEVPGQKLTRIRWALGNFGYYMRSRNKNRSE